MMAGGVEFIISRLKKTKYILCRFAFITIRKKL